MFTIPDVSLLCRTRKQLLLHYPKTSGCCMEQGNMEQGKKMFADSTGNDICDFDVFVY